jgi:hypothetical protein
MAAKRNLCKVSAVCCDAMNLSGYYIYHVIVSFPIAVAVRPDCFTREYLQAGLCNVDTLCFLSGEK